MDPRETSDLVGLSEFSKDETFWRAIIAEFFGTMILVLVGCASCLSGWTMTNDPNIIQIAFAFGLIVATMVQCLGHVSGCHINPAVTFGLLISRQISLVRAVLYITVQCIGAIAGAALLTATTPIEKRGTLGATIPDDSVTVVEAFGVELVISLILVMTVHSVCDKNRIDTKDSEALSIGLAITACHLAAIPISGSSMNPARSLGPAIMSGIWKHHWVYWVGPISGAAIASFLYTFVFRLQPRQLLTSFQAI